MNDTRQQPDAARPSARRGRMARAVIDAFTDPTAPASDAIRPGPGRLRLRTLTWLRWVAVIGQSSALSLVYFGLGFEVPIIACFVVIAASVVVNVVVTLTQPNTKMLTELEAFAYLAFDILQLAALVYLTGGIENPFAILFLAPVTISASTLNVRSTLGLGALAGLLVTFLAVSHQPLPWSPDARFVLPDTYLLGMWIALLLGIGFTAAYAWRVAVEGQRLSEALTATQLVLAREQRMTALGGLAAAAAHELGTPLATIQLTARELQRDVPEDSPYAEDIALINSQASRCRDILRGLTVRGDEGDAIFARQRLTQMVNEVTERYASEDVEIAIHESGPGPEPEIWRRPEIIYGLGCFVQNAVDFADDTVDIAVDYDDASITIVIADNGPGFSPDVLNRLGEPYVTTRGRSQRRLGAGSDRLGRSAEGLGLGVFIAKTLLEHTGATVRFSTAVVEGGARVEVHWSRGQVEASAMAAAEDRAPSTGTPAPQATK